MKYLLDTHMFIWWFEDSKKLGRKVKKILNNASEANPLFLSDITLWEIAVLVELGRLKLDRPLREWLETAVAPPLVICYRLTPAIVTQVAQLPAAFHRDPADTIIISTTMVLSATLLTIDRRMIESRLVPTLH